MKYGLYVPPCGDYADARVLANLALDAEQAGWEGFFVWDHLMMGWPDPVVDPWVALTAIAMNTHRIRFGPLVTPLPRRRPWVLARQTASLDHLSGGRLILGVGLGYGNTEFEPFGEQLDYKVRAEILDEALLVLDGLWSGEPFSFKGRHYTVQEVSFKPAPLQRPRIPVWAAGFWPNKPPFRRAARLDGVFPLMENGELMMSTDQVRQVVQFIEQHRQSEGPFDIVHSGQTPGDDPAAAEMASQYAAAGVTWWLENINPWRFGYDWQQHLHWPVEAMRERILQGPPRFE